MEIQFAERKDVGDILDFIKQLAEYEHMADEVVVPMDEWTVYRITGETLEEMGKR